MLKAKLQKPQFPAKTKCKAWIISAHPMVENKCGICSETQKGEYKRNEKDQRWELVFSSGSIV